MRKAIYVAGPYSSDPVPCTELAVKYGDALLDHGFSPFVPHLSHYWDTLHNQRTYEDWMELDLAWVAKADMVLRIPGESKGADREVELALSLGIPVYYDLAALLICEGAVPYDY